MRTLVIGYDGEDSGHGRYCRTFVAALRAAGEDAALHSQVAMPRHRVFQLPVAKQVDRMARAIANAARSIDAIHRHAPRVVHFQLFTPIVDRWWIPRLMRDRVSVLTMHNVEPHEDSHAFSPSLVSGVLRSMDALVVHSNANKRRLTELYPELGDKISVIPHGVWQPAHIIDRRAARIALDLNLDQPIVLFFGVIRRNKGLGLLLEAIAELRRTTASPPALLIAGEPAAPDGFEQYDARIRQLGLHNCVITHIGRIPEHRVAMFYSAADIVALPYQTDFQAQSGILFDAYAHSIPVVVTDVGAVGETVRKDGTGLVVASPRVAEFSLALARLLADEGARRRMVERMRVLAKSEYSWQIVAARTRELYARTERSIDQKRLDTKVGQVTNVRA